MNPITEPAVPSEIAKRVSEARNFMFAAAEILESVNKELRGRADAASLVTRSDLRDAERTLNAALGYADDSILREKW